MSPNAVLKELNEEISDIRREQLGKILAELGDTRDGVGLDADGIPKIKFLKTDVSFSIAKYPITYIQMEAFHNACDGYREEINQHEILKL